MSLSYLTQALSVNASQSFGLDRNCLCGGNPGAGLKMRSASDVITIPPRSSNSLVSTPVLHSTSFLLAA